VNAEQRKARRDAAIARQRKLVAVHESAHAVAYFVAAYPNAFIGDQGLSVTRPENDPWNGFFDHRHIGHSVGAAQLAEHMASFFIGPLAECAHSGQLDVRCCMADFAGAVNIECPPSGFDPVRYKQLERMTMQCLLLARDPKADVGIVIDDPEADRSARDAVALAMQWLTEYRDEIEALSEMLVARGRISAEELMHWWTSRDALSLANNSTARAVNSLEVNY